jgi:hypothetical protein
MSEEYGFKGGTVLLSLAGLLALSLLQLELDVGGLPVLLVVDGVCDTSPEAEGLVGSLLLVWG